MELSLFQAIELTPITLSMFRIFYPCLEYPCLGYIIYAKKYYPCWYIFSMFGIYYPCLGYIIHVWDILSMFVIYYPCRVYIIHV